KFAPERKPDLFINVGDNFYWGGVNTYCGTPMHKIDPVTAHQFREIYENVYHGPGVDGKPWLSVLGNHDYGGFQFNKAWDQQISYTWASDRWVMPGQYFMQRVEYPGFSVEIFMLDSNAMDSHPKSADPKHNICGAAHNPPGATCAGTGGPKDLDACFKFMWDTWRSQQKWTEKKLQESTADWQLVATHFQCGHQAQWYKKLHQKLGLDLLVTGHTHVQSIFHKWHVLGGLTCFITGGGGGITSENAPDHSHTTAYGFFDLAFTKDSLHLESINFLGNKVGSATVTPVGLNAVTESESESESK
ncbi:ACP5, partial [Symbiodinium pilosum]